MKAYLYDATKWNTLHDAISVRPWPVKKRDLVEYNMTNFYSETVNKPFEAEARLNNI
jgi:hypothetical protein